MAQYNREHNNITWHSITGDIIAQRLFTTVGQYYRFRIFFSTIVPGGLPGLQNAPENNLMLMMMTWLALALVLFLMRPRSLRNKADADYRNNEGDDGRPPMPPAVN